ncbi:MAG: hypothetical protein Q7S40_30995 [Opitutaceae bacterium]|nr:hypothetical protein [Opitutaceae bacterium]
MATIGIELSDAGFVTAACAGSDPRLVDVVDQIGSAEWPGYCYQDGAKLLFGRAGEDNWFVHPRRVVHTFWSRLAHEPSPLQGGTKPPSFSELGFFFLREFVSRLNASAGPYEQIVFAIPGAYLKDAGTAEEKIGLLLGMAGELKLPLAGMIDLACAALCDPRANGFNPALPVVVLDLHLEGTDLTLLTTDGRLERKDFIHLPQWGYAHLLKQLTGTMGNRFLRQTTFDILEDGRIEQTFFRQTKEFFVSEPPEFRFHINTATRGYEMIAKREQIASDAQSFVGGLVQALQSFIKNSPHASEPCTIAITDRAAHLPGLEARLRAAGYSRLMRLPRGAAAAGAACIGGRRLKVPADLGDVAVETSVPLSDTRRSSALQWDARLQKHRDSGPPVAPTHAILNGIGHVIGTKPRFTIGHPDLGADVPLPENFSGADDCAVPLVHEGGRLWFVDAGPGRSLAGMETPAARTPIDAGDSLTVRCGNATAEILFAHCRPTNGSHAA